MSILLVFIIVFLAFVLIHEFMHLLMAKMLGVPARLELKWWGFYVNLPGFSGKKFSMLSKSEKKKYNAIALAPYVILIPAFLIATFLTYNKGLTDYFAIFFSILVANFVALPMEWIVS